MSQSFCRRLACIAAKARLPPAPLATPHQRRWRWEGIAQGLTGFALALFFALVNPLLRFAPGQPQKSA